MIDSKGGFSHPCLPAFLPYFLSPFSHPFLVSLSLSLTFHSLLFLPVPAFSLPFPLHSSVSNPYLPSHLSSSFPPPILSFCSPSKFHLSPIHPLHRPPPHPSSFNFSPSLLLSPALPVLPLVFHSFSCQPPLCHPFFWKLLVLIPLLLFLPLSSSRHSSLPKQSPPRSVTNSPAAQKR